MAKTLKMTFALDDEKTKTIALADPKDDISSGEVSGFMGQVIAKNAMSVNGAKAASAKSAYVEEVQKTVLF